MPPLNLERSNGQLFSLIKKRGALYGLLVIVIFLFLFYYFFYQTPREFKENSTIRIEKGQSLTSISRSLKQQGIVSSSFWLTNLILIFGGEHKVVAGYYLFQEPNDLFKVARRLTRGNFGILPIKVTIPEGLNAKEISTIYKSRLNLFDQESFYSLAKEKEGYLFPETYFFVPTILPEDVLVMMTNTFDKQISNLRPNIAESGHSVAEIVTMASILEGEAKTSADRKMVAGILWKRITLGIPLQVDSSFKYINGKSSSELLLSDLKKDSPYNSYSRTGLPPTPISNPGLDAINAALDPTPSDYLYFLSDKNGGMHYGKTLKEHAINRAKYL